MISVHVELSAATQGDQVLDLVAWIALALNQEAPTGLMVHSITAEVSDA